MKALIQPGTYRVYISSGNICLDPIDRTAFLDRDAYHASLYNSFLGHYTTSDIDVSAQNPLGMNQLRRIGNGESVIPTVPSQPAWNKITGSNVYGNLVLPIITEAPLWAGRGYGLEVCCYYNRKNSTPYIVSQTLPIMDMEFEPAVDELFLGKYSSPGSPIATYKYDITFEDGTEQEYRSLDVSSNAYMTSFGKKIKKVSMSLLSNVALSLIRMRTVHGVLDRTIPVLDTPPAVKWPNLDTTYLRSNPYSAGERYVCQEIKVSHKQEENALFVPTPNYVKDYAYYIPKFEVQAPVLVEGGKK